jgi:non-ribosomal peptide synthetase component F
MSKAWAEDQRLHQLIESQAERTPHSIAAIFEDQQLTYCELNARANQVGHRLRRLGVGPNTLVGLPQSQQSCRLGRTGQLIKTVGREQELKRDYRSSLEDRRI